MIVRNKDNTETLRRAEKDLHNDVVDGNMDQLDEESNKSHERKTNRSSNNNAHVFCKNNEMRKATVTLASIHTER